MERAKKVGLIARRKTDEIVDKEVDDLDAFLGIKSEKKSQRKEYNFTPSVNNLHDGKAANGYEPAPKKKGAWIENAH